MATVLKRIAAALPGILVGFIINYLACPAITIRSSGFCGMIFWTIAVIAFGEFVVDYFEDEEYGGLISVIATATALILLFIGGISGSKMLNAEKYQKMVEIEQGDFEEDIPKLSSKAPEIQVVDLEIAQKVGDRTIGNLENSTWYEVDDEYNLIEYNDKYYRISPLNYGNSFFKYQKAKSYGIPGYVIVDAWSQEAKYVKLDKEMYYSPSAYFSKNLTRHLRGQFSNYTFGTSYFEIDDEGNPWWITSAKKATIGLFSGQKVQKVIITDPHTGDSKAYDIKDLPNWVDHAYELSYLMKNTASNFHFVHGFKNYLFGQKDVKNIAYEYASTEESFAGYNSTISKNGIAFFTGVTPANGAETNVGFVLLNTRTGAVKYYECPGAEESSAQDSAESLTQNYGYQASYPTVVNVDGIETYFMTLKDKAGLIQRYALCNVENYTIVVEASSIPEVISKYKEKLGVEAQTEENEEEKVEITGVITKITSAEISGTTNYYFMLENDSNIYVSSIKLSQKQAFMEVGTKVTISVVNTSEEGVLEVKEISIVS